MYAPMCEWKDWKGRIFVMDMEGRMYHINKPETRGADAGGKDEAEDGCYEDDQAEIEAEIASPGRADR
jgi:hypothetical protein